MENTEETYAMLHQISSPAFLVRDGIIAQVNYGARQRQILPDTPVQALLLTGKEEYNNGDVKYEYGEIGGDGNFIISGAFSGDYTISDGSFSGGFITITGGFNRPQNLDANLQSLLKFLGI